MKMNNDTKIEEELTCQFEIDMRNLTNFDLKRFPFHRLFLTKAYNAWAKKSIEELYCWPWEMDAKTGLCFLNVFI